MAKKNTGMSVTPCIPIIRTTMKQRVRHASGDGTPVRIARGAPMIDETDNSTHYNCYPAFTEAV